MEQDRFTITRARLHRVHLGENVAVGDEKIEPGVVVHVKKARAPSDQTIILMAEAGSPAHVLEAFRAHIAIQRIGLLGKIFFLMIRPPPRSTLFPYTTVGL